MINNNLKNNVLDIFKKRDLLGYELYKEYMQTDMKDQKKNKKIENRALSLYLSSLTKDDLKRLKVIEQCIKGLKISLQYSTLSTIDETHIIDVPETYYSKIIFNGANKIGLRDQEGFYGTDEIIQKEFDRYNIEFDCLHKELLLKEEIMSGKKTIKKKTLLRKEVLILANFIGYGSFRDNLLENQARNKNKVLIKSKEQILK